MEKLKPETVESSQKSPQSQSDWWVEGYPKHRVYEWIKLPDCIRWAAGIL